MMSTWFADGSVCLIMLESETPQDWMSGNLYIWSPSTEKSRSAQPTRQQPQQLYDNNMKLDNHVL